MSAFTLQDCRQGDDPAVRSLQDRAMMDARTDDPGGVVTRMRVEPVHQRREYGQRLPDELTRRARQLWYRELLLDTDPEQTAARAVYEASGFQRVGTVEVEGVADPTPLLYRKRVD